MHRYLCVFILLSVAISAQAAGAQQDFAYRALLSESDQQLQRIELPINVVIDLAHPDLSDLAVFNINGKQLPHSVLRSRGNVTSLNQELSFHEFDRYLRQHSKTVTTREQNQQADSLSELQTTETIAVQSVRKDYLIELSSDAKTPAFDRIELVWVHEPAAQILEVRVEVGNELDKLRVISPRKSLTNQPSRDSSWRSISGIPRNQKYLRLTPANEISRFELQKVTGHYQQTEPAAVLTFSLEPDVSDEEQGRFFHFEFPSVVNAEALRILPGESNSVLSGDIYATWTNVETRKRITRDYRQHNIDSDDVKPSNPIKLSRRAYQHIWFSSHADLVDPPRVELIYPQYELIFLGDDNGPYTLAWGNYEASPQVTDLGGLLEGNLQQAQQRGGLVSLGKIEEVGGPDRLAPQAPLPWKKWLLWTLLILAAIVTARMAFKLYREMDATASN